MKLAILTFSQSYNYGALLQSYALQKTLCRLGHEALLIRIGEPPKPKTLKYKLKNLLEYKRQKAYCEFLHNHLTFYETIITPENAYILNSDFDGFISGSDQVWNMKNGIDPIFFQKFANKNKLKMSYSASIGLNEIPEKYRDESICLINDFDYVSLREISALRMLQQYTDRKLYCHADPVFLLNKSEWDNLCENLIEQKNYIFVYGTQMSETLKHFAENLHQKTGLPLISVFPLKNAKVVGGAIGCKEFVSYIKNADYVITSSFHCTAFSMIYQKRVFVIPHSETFSRTEDLLSIFGQSDCIIKNSDDVVKSVWDFSQNQNIIDCLQKSAFVYLKTIDKFGI